MQSPPDSKAGRKQKEHVLGGDDIISQGDQPSEAGCEATEPSPAPEAGKQRQSKKGENPVKPKNLVHERRTVFVGNLPLGVRRAEVRKFFMQYAPVESLRLRSAPRLDSKKPIRMSVITKRFSTERSSFNAYVRFVSEEDAARAAAAANGVLFKEHRLRVNASMSSERPDPRRAVFVGGLPLNVEDDHLWAHFGECGDIVSVRVIRDSLSSVGKGFGYVNFGDEQAAHRALKLNGSEMGGRHIRVQKCHATAKPKVDRTTGKKLRREKGAEGEGEGPRPLRPPDKLAPVSSFSGDATAESKSSLKKKKKKKERWDDAKRQKRNLAQSLSKTIAPAAGARSSMAAPTTAPAVKVGGVLPQSKKIKFDFDNETDTASDKKKDAEKMKAIKLKKEAKRKKKSKESLAKKKRSVVEPLTNILPS
ncbi:RNA-binding protein 34-like [Pollicipes pollicipes]|uniref:RNA-binding protein 34-like n=1 Tax=Pollicipes pollicipes TaxID=41117 RepID=UPI0018857062|nr:RNA-binding protein 34-like [Pollicipes pollicipes]XP_037073001.1 RNA-binding protein 34-like [Pollicipes pollicipes]XP_037073002.1 RNA-binding protein 34-like [Pollicipes pollicipes]